MFYVNFKVFHVNTYKNLGTFNMIITIIPITFRFSFYFSAPFSFSLNLNIKAVKNIV